MNILKKLALVVLCTFGVVSAHADEGMWLPQYLKKDHAKALKKAGLKIPVTEIYNEERSSLKDAVVIFGRGCTGEIVRLLVDSTPLGYRSQLPPKRFCGYVAWRGASRRGIDRNLHP